MCLGTVAGKDTTKINYFKYKYKNESAMDVIKMLGCLYSTGMFKVSHSLKN